ncbi:hypothetical protein Tco_0438213 [Tanacetum coccineum]
MRTRSQARRRRQPQVRQTSVESSNLEKPDNPPIVTMADNRTMAQLLEAPTEGYEDAIVIPEITANNFEIKHGLLNLVQNKQFFGNDKEDPHAHIRYFNKITSTMKIPERTKYVLNLCFPGMPSSWFSELHQHDPSYNGPNSIIKIHLPAAGGNFLRQNARECLKSSRASLRTSAANFQPSKFLVIDLAMVSNQIRPPGFPPIQNPHANSQNTLIEEITSITKEEQLQPRTDLSTSVQSTSSSSRTAPQTHQKTVESSVDELPVELKELPPHLEYAFLEGDDKLPVIIAKDLKDEEKAALLKVLKSHKRAIAWKLSDIKGVSPEFCTHKILMEEDYEPSVQSQRRVNPKIHDVIKKEVEKLLDAGLIYPISDSPWVSPVHCVPKKGGMTVITNEDNELIPTRLVTGWRVCIDYRKLNEATRKDHFPLPFMDQMLERLAGNEYYCFLDGFSGYFQIPIDPKDQEKTTFTCPYGTFAYRRMPLEPNTILAII